MQQEGELRAVVQAQLVVLDPVRPIIHLNRLIELACIEPAQAQQLEQEVVKVGWHVRVEQGSMENELHRVDEHPGGQKAPPKPDQQKDEDEGGQDEPSHQVTEDLDVLSLRFAQLALYLPVKLGAELHLDALLALKELDAPESHLYVIVRVEGTHVLRVVKVDLEPNEVIAVANGVPFEVFDVRLDL